MECPPRRMEDLRWQDQTLCPAAYAYTPGSRYLARLVVPLNYLPCPTWTPRPPQASPPTSIPRASSAGLRLTSLRHSSAALRDGRTSRPPLRGKRIWLGHGAPRKTADLSKLPGDPRVCAPRGDAQTWKSLDCLGPPRVARRARRSFFRGGGQSHRSAVSGGAPGAYCRWLSGCSASWQLLHTASSCRRSPS